MLTCETRSVTNSDTRSPVDDVVRALWDDFLSDVETLAELQKIRKKPTPAGKLEGLEDDAPRKARSMSEPFAEPRGRSG